MSQLQCDLTKLLLNERGEKSYRLGAQERCRPQSSLVTITLQKKQSQLVP